MIKFTSSLFYKLSTAFCLLYTCEGFSVTSSQVFEKYPNKALVETGTFYGNGVENALKAGFKEVYSIELSPDLYQYCYEKFKSNPNVHIYLGDSSVVLKDVLAKINDPVTFWLDGHYSEGVTAKGNKNSPILEEIAAIGQHKIKNHTILIDDVRLFGTREFDNVTQDQVIAAIKAINKDYEISFEERITKPVVDQIVLKFPKEQADFLLSKDAFMIDGGFQGLSRDVLANYVMPMYQNSKNLGLFEDDGSSRRGFGEGRHDQTLFSIYANLNKMNMNPQGWSQIQFDGKSQPFHMHWDRNEINDTTCVYRSRGDYHYGGDKVSFIHWKKPIDAQKKLY